MKKAILFDLDNTLMDTVGYGEQIFGTLFRLIAADGGYSGDLQSIKDVVVRKPFQWISEKFQFSDQLHNAGLQLLRHLSVPFKMAPFPGYDLVKALPLDKLLVTTGFTHLQQSKIDSLGIGDDFKKIDIVDPDREKRTKKDAFATILKEYNFQLEDVLVVGDDVDAEIKAAHELGIDSLLFDARMTGPALENKVHSLAEVVHFIRFSNNGAQGG